jgi:Zn-dependent peptidase ImmA (M78 family)
MGFTLDDAAKKIGVSPAKLAAAESGQGHLTMRQAEAAAKTYDRPTAALFLPEAPQEEPPEAKFRRLPDAPPLPWSPEMHALSRRVRERQDAALEIYELLEEVPRWQSMNIEYSDDAALLGRRARASLAMDLDEQRSWRDSSGYRALREWVDAVESLGILVMQDGTVPVEVMRGFASPHDEVPAIVVNTDDDARARAFTVVHELGHLLRASAGRRVRPADEAWCDDFAGEVIVPEHALRSDMAEQASGRDLLSIVDNLALTYGVTPRALAVRLRRQQLVADHEASAVIRQISTRSQAHSRSTGGGNYYRSTLGRLGPSFIRLVFAALDNQAVSYAVAAGVLGVKVNNFGKLREALISRSALG